jgi:hypothetical protein
MCLVNFACNHVRPSVQGFSDVAQTTACNHLSEPAILARITSFRGLLIVGAYDLPKWANSAMDQSVSLLDLKALPPEVIVSLSALEVKIACLDDA